jgi:hypothetical protein
VVPSAAGAVVLVPFPFFDSSRSNLRAVPLDNADFQVGSLRVKSYARPGKLFTANQQLIVSQAWAAHGRVVHAGFGCCGGIAPILSP